MNGMPIPAPQVTCRIAGKRRIAPPFGIVSGAPSWEVQLSRVNLVRPNTA